MPDVDVYRLEAPAQPDSLTVARLFVATTFRLLALEENVLHDARLAVSELLTSALLEGDADRLEVAITDDGSSVSITVSPVRPGGAEDEGPAPMDIVSTLFPDVVVDEVHSTATIPVISRVTP